MAVVPGWFDNPRFDGLGTLAFGLGVCFRRIRSCQMDLVRPHDASLFGDPCASDGSIVDFTW